MRVGYIRVSSVGQNPQRQSEELETRGRVEKIFTESASGRTGGERPGLDECLTFLREGDVLVVSSIDRLARSLVDLRKTVDAVIEKGAAVEFLHENLKFSRDSADARADLMLGILGSFAEFERAIIRERQAEGIALARARGAYKGRKRALTPAQVAEVEGRIASGEAKAAIARELGIARSTLYAALKRK